MKNFHSPGKILAMVAPADVSSGDVVVVGSIAGVAAGDALSGATMQLQVEGVFDLPKDGNAITAGAKVYATSGGVITATASGNTAIGFAPLAAAGGDATVRVKIAL